MTADELEQFRSQLAKSEAQNQTDFVLRLLPDIPDSVNYEAKKMLAELKRQGNNLNQMVRALHSGTATEKGAQQVLRECHALYKEILKKV